MARGAGKENRSRGRRAAGGGRRAAGELSPRGYVRAGHGLGIRSLAVGTSSRPVPMARRVSEFGTCGGCVLEFGTCGSGVCHRYRTRCAVGFCDDVSADVCAGGRLGDGAGVEEALPRSVSVAQRSATGTDLEGRELCGCHAYRSRGPLVGASRPRRRDERSRRVGAPTSTDLAPPRGRTSANLAGTRPRAHMTLPTRPSEIRRTGTTLELSATCPARPRRAPRSGRRARSAPRARRPRRCGRRRRPGRGGRS